MNRLSPLIILPVIRHFSDLTMISWLQTSSSFIIISKVESLSFMLLRVCTSATAVQAVLQLTEILRVDFSRCKRNFLLGAPKTWGEEENMPFLWSARWKKQLYCPAELLIPQVTITSLNSIHKQRLVCWILIYVLVSLYWFLAIEFSETCELREACSCHFRLRQLNG